MWSLIPSRSERRTAPVRPSRLLFFSLVGGFLLTLLPHVEQLPWWVILAVGAGMVYRSVGELRRWRLPSPTFCGLLALCLLAAVFFQFGTIFGRDAGTAFMAGLLAIKFFEMRGPRDQALIIFCSFFVVMSSLLYSQEIELFLYCLLMMWVLTALLLRTSMGDLPDQRLIRLLGTSGLIFLQALPLAVFLFFLFPRYHGVLQLGADETSIGLTDKVEPGSISRLAENDSTAMMAQVDSPGILTPESLYWRALVLWQYRDGAWTPGVGLDAPRQRSEALPHRAPGTPEILQKITIYPHFHRWLFALDYPVGFAEATDGTAGFSEALNGGTLRLKGADTGVNRKEQYTVPSSPLLAPQELSEDLRHAALQLPPDGASDQIDPRVQALAAKLQQGCRTEDDYIRSVLYYFRHEGFVYTDAPGVQGKNALANFLLINHRGFCEHYASAFAVLMRLGNIPARMVVGYQGAQFNPYSNIYVVKQSNAHAWDEVWIDRDKYWRRVDPTAILSGHETLTGAAQPAGGDLSINVANHRFTLISHGYLPDWVSRAVLETQLRRQEMEANWNDWIFSYDPEAQGRLAQALGFRQKQRTLLGLASLAALMIAAGLLLWGMKPRARLSPVEKFYARFCRRLARRGAPRADWEGPIGYTARVARVFPQDETALTEAGRLVAQSRYAIKPPDPSPAQLHALLHSLSAEHAASSAPDED